MTQPLAVLVETIGRACLKFAEEIRSAEAELTVEDTVDPVEELELGARQREIVEILRNAGDEGITTAQIASQIEGYDSANAHMALRTLQNRRVIEEIPTKKPIRWRLAQQYRATADPYLAVAAQVRSGEWTTYGDISIAVRGDMQGARAVGRAAATLEHFPNPHRILQSGGKIPDKWRTIDSEDPNPEICRQRLAAEKVSFDEFGKARRKHYVAWDVLLERIEHE